MTFALDAVAEPSNVPPRVALTATEDDVDLSLQSVALFRDGVPLRFETAVTGDSAIAYDYDAPFDVALLYRADAAEVGSPVDFTETWASLTWTGTGWAVGSGIASSTAAAAVIYRDVSAGSVLQMDVVAPSNLTYQLTDASNNVIVSVRVSPDGTVTLTGTSASKVTGSGAFSLSLAGSTAAIVGTGWSTMVAYSGAPTRVRLVAPGIATFVAQYTTAVTVNASDPRGLAFNSTGDYFVADFGRGKILKFNSAGVYQSEFGTYGTGSGQMKQPYGVAIDASDNIWVADWANNKVLKFNSSGVFQAQYGSTGTGNGQFKNPTDIGFKSTGNFVVTDFTNNRVQEFNAAGTYQSQFAVAGGPKGVVIGASNDIIVATYTANGVLRYNASGVLQDTFDAADLNKPTLLARDASGYVYVSDSTNGRVVKFDSTGVLVGSFGAYGKGGNGQFSYPSGIKVLASTDVYVVNSLTGTTQSAVQKFTQAGGSTDDITVRVDLASDPLEVSATDTATLSPTGVTAGAWLTNSAIPDLAVLLAAGDASADYLIIPETREQASLQTNSVALEIEGSADVLTVTVGPRKRETWSLVIAATSYAARQTLLALLANDAPISMRFPATGYEGLEDGFYAVGDIDANRLGHPALPHAHVISLPLTQGRAPKFKALWQWSWDTLAQTGMTWDDVAVAFTSWNDLLLGPD